MAEVLYVPNRERVVTTNAWAFLHWLRTTRGVDLRDWAGLQQWSVSDPATFTAAVSEFGGRNGDAEDLADRLLFTDLRPDDRVSEVEPDCPDPLAQAVRNHATVLIAPAQTLANGTFQRPGRHNLADLRTIVVIGGPMSPEARRRIYTWVKADVMLLARAGDTYWGNPLEPVSAEPSATPAFLRLRPSVPLPR
jgi:hypothetical protein